MKKHALYFDIVNSAQSDMVRTVINHLHMQSISKYNCIRNMCTNSWFLIT